MDCPTLALFHGVRAGMVLARATGSEAIMSKQIRSFLIVICIAAATGCVSSPTDETVVEGDDSTLKLWKFCGGTICPAGEVCCDSSCGLCAPEGTACNTLLPCPIDPCDKQCGPFELCA